MSCIRRLFVPRSLACCLAGPFLLVACTGMAQREADVALDKLCFDAGGLQVYETVALPPETKMYATERYLAHESRFRTPMRVKGNKPYQRVPQYQELVPVFRTRQVLNPAFFDPSAGTAALGPDYLWQDGGEIVRAQDGSETFRRNHFRIIRRSDDKVLGEIVYFSRKAGGLAHALGLGGAGIRCPENIDFRDLVTAVFTEAKGEACR